MLRQARKQLLKKDCIMEHPFLQVWVMSLFNTSSIVIILALESRNTYSVDHSGWTEHGWIFLKLVFLLTDELSLP